MTFLAENDGYDVLYELRNLAIAAVKDLDDDTEEIWTLKAELLNELRGLDFDLLFDFEPNVDRESDLSKAVFVRDAMNLLAGALGTPVDTSAADELVELLTEGDD